MGAQSSKINSEKDISTSTGHLPSTPISTPKPKVIDCDPRSPSANIVRTPIQSAANLTQADTTPVTPITPITPIIGVIKKGEHVTLDPRSPTVEFTRTPVITDCIKPRNKNLEIVRQQCMNFSPMKPHGTEINPRIKGPILLGVSPVTKKINQEKRKSYIGLLETDLDFVETDLDEAVKPKQVDVDVDVDIDDEPKEKIIKTGLVVDNELIISPIKETLEKISQIDEDIKEVIAIARNSIDDIDIDEECASNAFDKKVANLIYEDQGIVNIPKNVKSISSSGNGNSGSRTPLGERNVNQKSKKSASKLRVHDKPTLNKNEFAVSKIPVFREKKGKKIITTQCENTPPRQMTDIKKNGNSTQWDADKTLLI